MEALVDKVKHNISEWPRNFPRDLNRNNFFNFLKEYQEIVKYMPRTIIEPNKDDVNESNGKIKKNEKKGRNDNFSQKEVEVNQGTTPLGKTPRIEKIEQLHEKLKVLRGKSLNTIDTLKRKGLKNRLKKKLKLEERMKLNSKRKKNTVFKPNNAPGNSNISVKEERESKETKQNEVVYSKFDFPDGIDEDKKKKGPRDPMRILQKVEKSRKKLREMEARGRDEKVKEIKGRLAWETAIKKAEGQKVKDDVELLKKSIKKIKNAKNRSKKKWEEREKSKVQKMEEVQKKRKTNIQNKKKQKQKKKVKKLIKKGRILP